MGARWLTLCLTFSLIVSLFAPYIALGAAAQPGGQLPPPFPAPQRVALAGNFQSLLGCPADLDPTCPQSQLNDNGDGSWSAVLPIPPGSYSFRVVASSRDGDRSLGQGGDQNAPDVQLTVPPDAAGAYIAYDGLTGEITADPVSARVTLRTDTGDDLALAPQPDGNFQVTWDAQPGAYGFQVFVNDQPVTQDGVSLDAPDRVLVAVDPTGAVLDKRTIPTTELEVSATDASGQPRPGSCFALLDQFGDLQSQTCDEDDGAPDGRVTLPVPDGLPNGTFTLRETQTASGEPAPDQDLPLGAGDFQATMQAGGDATQEQGTEPGEETETPTAEPGDEATAEPGTDQVIETPTTEPGTDQQQPTGDGTVTVQPGDAPGRLTITSVDINGQPLPGACFSIVEYSFELCDVTGSGEVIFDAVPATPLTLRETVPPAGFVPVNDIPITVEVTGAHIDVPHQTEGGQTPPDGETPVSEEQTPTPGDQGTAAPQITGVGQVVLTLRGRDDVAVTGACWELTPRDGTGSLEVCDADDGDDGQITFQNVPAGRYRLQETQTPTGFAPADAQNIEVSDGQTAEVAIAYRDDRNAGENTGPGRLVIVVSDEDGNPLPQTCFDLTGPENLPDVCDGQDDGRLNLPDIASGEYTVTQTQTADGFEIAAPTTVTVPGGETVELPITNEREGAEAPQDAAGDVVVTITGADGAPAENACATLTDAAGDIAACDNDGEDADQQQGRVAFRDVPAGRYTLTVQPGDDSPAPAAQTIEVQAGESVAVEVGLTASDEAPLPDTGNLDIRAEDADGNPLPSACYTVEIPPAGQGFGPFCDEDGNGTVSIQGVSPGPIRVIETTPPTNSPAADPAQQDLDIAAGELAEAVFSHGETAPQQEATGELAVSIADANGEPVGGACIDLTSEADAFRVCDNQQGDDEGEDGSFLIPNLPAGDYEVALSDLPDGAAAPDAQQATITGGETANVDFTIGGGPGTLVLFVENEQGDRLGGSCFTLDNGVDPLLEVCDQGDDGRLNIPDLPPGEYTVVQTDAAEGQQLAPEQQVTLPAGQTVEVTLVNPAESAPATPTPEATTTPEATETATPDDAATATATATAPTTPVTPVPGGDTGAVELEAFDDNGDPIAGQCYMLSGAAGQFGPYCDNGEGDSSGDPGIITITGLPTGSYEAVLQTPAGEPDVEVAQSADTRRSVTVGKGNRPTRAQFRVRNQQNRRGDLLIRVRDGDGRYLAGACFALTANGSNNPAAEVCDNDATDQNSSAGRILLTGLRAGRYTLTQESAPTGYQTAANQNVRIQGGQVTEVAVVNQAVMDQSATIDVRTVNGNGDLLPGACYTLMKGNETTEACDADTGADGVTTFAEIAPGSYVVRQTQPPTGGYALGGSTATVVNAGESKTVTITNQLRPGSLLIRTTNPGGEALADACYALNRDDRTRYTVCDNDANDGNAAPGVILLSAVTAGSYVLVETQAPAGYLPVADQAVDIAGNQRTQVTVVNQPEPPAQRVGALRVFKTDANGNALAGACFALIDANGRLLFPACDSDDGADDGVILLANVAIGDYTLRETRRPSADYETAADQTVRITENQTTDVGVTNTLRPGRILIRVSNAGGALLANACFDLVEDAAGAQCTDENGETLFSGLAPGVYTINETQPPAGYLAAPAIDPVTVRPGSTASVLVVNQPAPPPTDSGSLQVVKFFCPTTPGNGGITFIDSSNPDGGGLARTAGCDLGDARFSLNGPDNLDFRTGAGGRYQATLDTGEYVLTELGTGASEPLVISVNTLTTVVVINYVEPEGEEPAAIDVVAYTCDPGFQGRVWADFADGCLDDTNLTNNVAYRLSGPFSARRVTGDGGVGGATEFTDLPPGDYRLRQETPTGTVAVYAFCGLDPAAPNGRSVGDALALRLAAGQQVTCYWFNVPEDLAGNTGAITVYKFACPVTTPSSSFDWYNRCDPQGAGVRFSLAVQNGDRFDPVTTAETDADGILRLTRLAPGIYDLQEVDAVWCHAESDNVDANGHVVVKAGERASVWIFNCVGAKNPPNTGAGPMWSGPAAALPQPEDRLPSAAQVLRERGRG
ncbi:MAG: SpaA isopeptide-forming pilin-related protein [Thermomicrobiales bacterium]